jgi:DNA mismatch repair ATPase MutS
MELRLKREAAGKKYGGGAGSSERLVNREICNVLTKGTFIDSKARGEDAYEPRYVLALKRSGNTLGVTFFDVSTLKFFIGQFQDDEVFSAFRTLIC